MKIERVKFRNFHIVFKSRFFFHELYSWWWIGGERRGRNCQWNRKRGSRSRTTDDARPGGLSKRPRLKKRRLWLRQSLPLVRVFWAACVSSRTEESWRVLDGSFLLCPPLFLYLLLRGSLSASSGGFTTQSLAPWTYWHSATHPWQNQTSVNLPIIGLR